MTFEFNYHQGKPSLNFILENIFTCSHWFSHFPLAPRMRNSRKAPRHKPGSNCGISQIPVRLSNDSRYASKRKSTPRATWARVRRAARVIAKTARAIAKERVKSEVRARDRAKHRAKAGAVIERSVLNTQNLLPHPPLTQHVTLESGMRADLVLNGYGNISGKAE